MAMGGIGEAMLLNAAIGGTVSAVAGGDPLKGALLGGLSGGLMSGIGGAAAAGTNAATSAATSAGQGLASLGGQSFAQASQAANAAGAAGAAAPSAGLSSLGAVDGAASVLQAAAPAGFTGPPVIDAALKGAPMGGAAGFVPPPEPSMLGGMLDKFKAMPLEKQLMIGGMGAAGLAGLMQRPNVPGAKEDDSELKKFRYRIGNYSPSPFAGGGIVALMRGGPSDLGSYSDGGRMLKGPGDGMSDNIPGVIGGKRPARLADGEFVVPADVVSHLGNGSTDAGAKQLYAMMDRVRAARTGTKKQGKQINPSRMVPA